MKNPKTIDEIASARIKLMEAIKLLESSSLGIQETYAVNIKIVSAIGELDRLRREP